jgi:hypothetical protein
MLGYSRKKSLSYTFGTGIQMDSGQLIEILRMWTNQVIILNLSPSKGWYHINVEISQMEPFLENKN